MRPSDLHFFPLALPFVLGLFLLMGLLIALIEVGILEYAYTKIGVDRRYLFAVLLLSLFGSYVNIPVAHLPGEQVITGHVITYFGMRYVVPMVQEWPGTVIAVNVGREDVKAGQEEFLPCLPDLWKQRPQAVYWSWLKILPLLLPLPLTVIRVVVVASPAWAVT